MTVLTRDQLLHSIRALPRTERARLVATIVEELAEPPVEAPPEPSGWARWHAAVADFQTAYPNADVSARLDADRREREAAVQSEAPRVHT